MNRPRIDVIVQTSGQFRDIAATRLYLIDKAVKLAAEAKAETQANYVAESTLDAERLLKEKGMSPIDAREFSTVRVFGGLNGNYGTGIMGLVESGDRYDSDTTIANQYLKNMGAVYTKDHWAEYTPGLLEAAVQNTDAVMHTRTSNVSGPLSLDHVYEFMGGLNTVIKKVTGRDPDGIFLDMRNKYNTRAVDAKEAIWTEARSTILNPSFIKPLTKGGASSAETFAEYTRNTFAWNVTKESIIDEALWDEYHQTLVRDKLNLGVRDFFERENPYALQEISAVMLETVRKGLWSPDSAVIRELADIHVDLINRHDAGCSDFVCDNQKLQQMIANIVHTERAMQYTRAINDIRISTSAQNQAVVLKKESISRTLMDMAKRNLLALTIISIVVLLFVLSYIHTRIRTRD
jgi:cobaltochelatase CobN